MNEEIDGVSFFATQLRAELALNKEKLDGQIRKELAKADRSQSKVDLLIGEARVLNGVEDAVTKALGSWMGYKAQKAPKVIDVTPEPVDTSIAEPPVTPPLQDMTLPFRKPAVEI